MVLGVMLGSPLGSSHLPACSPLLSSVSPVPSLCFHPNECTPSVCSTEYDRNADCLGCHQDITRRQMARSLAAAQLCFQFCLPTSTGGGEPNGIGCWSLV